MCVVWRELGREKKMMERIVCGWWIRLVQHESERKQKVSMHNWNQNYWGECLSVRIKWFPLVNQGGCNDHFHGILAIALLTPIDNNTMLLTNWKISNLEYYCYYWLLIWNCILLIFGSFLILLLLPTKLLLLLLIYLILLPFN